MTKEKAANQPKERPAEAKQAMTSPHSQYSTTTSAVNRSNVNPTTTTSIIDSTNANPATDKHNVFPFLDLPPELRNRIYEYLFDRSTTTIRPRSIMSYRRWYFEHQLANVPMAFGVPALLATSRQLRTEASGIFYGRTTWILRSYYFVKHLARRLGPERMAQVTCMSYVIRCPVDVGSLEVEAINMRRVKGFREALDTLDLNVERERCRVEMQGTDGRTLWVRTMD